MASATPRTLPRSKSNGSASASAAAPSGTPVSTAPVPDDSRRHAHVDDASGLSRPWSHLENMYGEKSTPRSYAGIDTLVIVCCHAIFHPDVNDASFPLESPLDERNWHLAPFQKSDPKTGKPGEHETFLSHIAAGLDAVTAGKSFGNSLLVFSGGATKSSLTALSEARSYYNAALARGTALGHRGGGRAKLLYDKGLLLLEEHATDSFQNLFFSILLFRQTTGCYPSDIRIITHAFKARRFLDLHAPAIKWPPDRVRVQGLDPVMSRDEYEDTVSGEERFGYGPWKDDALGTGELLSKKRKQRGWDDTAQQDLGKGLEESVRQLLNGKVADRLPWSTPPSPERGDSWAGRQEDR